MARARQSQPARRPGAPLRLAVVGLGRVGRACARALAGAEELALSAIVRRPLGADLPLPPGVPRVPVVTEPAALRDVDAALVCVPSGRVLDAARLLLSRGVPIVEAAQLHALAFRDHRAAIDAEARRNGRPAVVGAGWDPGALPLLRGWLALLAPHGHTEARPRPAASLHHTLAARGVPGVRDALCAEHRAADGKLQRYVYVELEPGADLAHASAALLADPLFLGEETQVLPVESVAALEEEGHGLVLERWGAAGSGEHQRFLLEARFDPVVLTARVMLAAARALPALSAGAHALPDLPASALFGSHTAAAGESRP
jgi:diaminopimelate dehydrogenase